VEGGVSAEDVGIVALMVRALVFLFQFAVMADHRRATKGVSFGFVEIELVYVVVSWSFLT
jgi:hypothetical protein